MAGSAQSANQLEWVASIGFEAESTPILNFQSLIENYERRYGVGFWLGARRRGRHIPNAD